MRQFILTVGTIVTALLACWCAYEGAASISSGELGRSLLFLFVITPIALSLAVSFDYINAQMHQEYRQFRTSLARKKGGQRDMAHPYSKEVEETPWENDSSHTH